MMMHRFCFILIFISSIFIDDAIAQAFTFHLPQSEIQQIQYNEEIGLLWIELNNGKVFGYDGKDKVATDIRNFRARAFTNLSFDANAITSFDQESNQAPLPIVLSQDITEAVQIEDGRIFIGTQNGLYVSDDDYPQQFHHPFLEDEKAISGIYYYPPYLITTSDDGKMLLWNQVNNDISQINGPENIQDIVVDAFGMLWASNKIGIYNYPLQKELTTEAPKLLLNRIEVNGKKIVIENAISIGTRDNVKFFFTARQSARPEDILFSYRSVQVNTYAEGDLVSPISLSTSEPFVSYDNLEKGNYIIKASTTVDGKYFTHFPEIKVAVINKGLPMWIYFASALGAIILFLLYAAKRRYENFTKDISLQRDKLVLENEALKYQQKALQLQMNPHFIFNVLNSIQGLIAKGDNKSSRLYLNHFSQLMRLMLDQSRDDHITVEEEIKYLNYYLSLEQMCRNESFTFTIEIDPAIDQSISIPPMIIQPFVENAIVHGFKGIDYEGTISISFIEQEKDLKVIVQDNGVGLSAANDKSHRSHGMNIVKERLQKAFKNKNQHFSLIPNLNEAPGMVAKINLPVY